MFRLKTKFNFFVMKKIYGVIMLLIIVNSSITIGQNNLENKISWNGYAQVRTTTNFNNYNNFSIRRLKFWLKSGPEFSKHWSYKFQAIFLSAKNEAFTLQDIYGQYNWKNSSVRFGQFLPQFSLQRHQPDYKVPSTERARAISFLIPGAGLGASGGRDIGIQYNLSALEGKLKFNVGVFNGYGVTNFQYKNSGYMLSQNLSYEFNVSKSKIKLGYSVIYRDAHDLKLRTIIPDSITYSGSDFRYVFYGMIKSKLIDFQAEYIHATLSDGSADGYYGLLTVKPNAKNHVYLLYDSFMSDNTFFNNNPWYFAGYNYFFKGYNTMLTLETGFQQLNNNWENRTTLQLQIFLH